MKKISFIFPGQGSQYVGMGKYFYDNFSKSREVFDIADDVLGYSLSEKIFSGSQDDLNSTYLTQPAILTVSIAILKAIEDECDITPFLTAGLSLGEYAALVCSGFIDFNKAIPLVQKRAEFMMNSLSDNKYGMTAVIGLSETKILEVIDKVRDYGFISIANYNCPGQIVVSGELTAIEKSEVLFKEAGALRNVRLSVSSPFHTSLLSKAAENFRNELLNVEFKSEASVSVISNVTADKIFRDNIVDLLSSQIMSSVLWEKSILKMIDMGTDMFLEIGPGKTLSGFVKKINKKVEVHNVEDQSSLEKFLKVYSEV